MGCQPPSDALPGQGGPRVREAFELVYAGFRRVRLRRFPHSLYHRAEATGTVFFPLFHGARNPGLLRRTLRARGSET